MKTKTTLAALLLTAVMVTPSYGADEGFLEGSREFLYYKQTNKLPESIGQIMYFVGCVNGFYNGIGVAGYIAIPDSVDHSQMELIVARYVQQNPQWHHLHTADLMEKAVRNAFPQK
jgi:hypothetical protein